HIDVPTRVQTAISVDRIAEPYILRKAIKHLENGRVVIFAAGTGNPYFSTDTAAALRAAEIHADVLLCAKNIDGIYDRDPKLDKNAVKFDKITYMDVLNRDLKAMDLTAISICKENKIPVLVFGKDAPNSIVDAVEGKNVGTIIE
ncbi:MAG: UMP kinase, partial [Clostridia bacterium]